MKRKLCFAAPVFIFCAFQAAAHAQDPCQSALKDTARTDVVSQFVQPSGTGAFLDQVLESRVGRQLAACPQLADEAWSVILKAGHDASPRALASSTTELRIGILMAIYGETVDAAHVEKLKEFVRLRPWKLGFIFASALAVDSLLAYNHSPERDANYHNYSPDEMERALRQYAR